MRKFLLVLVALVALAVACSGKKGSSAPRTVFGGNRPVTLQIPSSYDGTTALPLMLILHGYSVNGAIQQSYFEMTAIADSKNTFVLAPNGTVDLNGNRFWNATDACCNFENSPVDDVAYLKGLIHDVEHDYNVDPKRIYIVGHSNGGYMAHRMACDDASDIAAIVSLAGAQWQDSTKCVPSEAVSVVQVHGTDDQEVLYAGDPGIYPGAIETVTRWQVYDSCTAGLVPRGANLDLDTTIPGAETIRQKFDGCPAGIDVELWSIEGAGHIPTFSPDWPQEVWGFFAAHPKP